MIKKSEYRFRERLRVRASEVDGRGVVSPAHQLNYLDLALAGYWRALGVPQSQAVRCLGGELCLSKLVADYEAPARVDDELDIALASRPADALSVVFDAELSRRGERLTRAELMCVFVDAGSHAVQRVPQRLFDVLQRFESGAPVIEVKIGSWDELEADATGIRTRVFIQEQGIPEHMEWDAADAGCLHAVAYNAFGLPLATGRLMEHVPGAAKIGRMAVDQAVRGSGVGRLVLDALMSAARGRGDREAVLHAQVSAASFYSRAGFVSRGPVFDDVGIPHIEMVCSL